MHKIDASGRPETYEEVNLSPKHIEVLVLAPGKAAAAFYYSEGRLKPKGSAGVDHYLTRVSQTFVKEGGRWKTRSSPPSCSSRLRGSCTCRHALYYRLSIRGLRTDVNGRLFAACACC